MIKIRILIVMLFFCGTAFSQIYTPTVPTVFGQNFNRIKPIMVQHLPEKTSLSLNTSDSTAQLFFNKADSQFYTYTKYTGFKVVGSGAGGNLLTVIVDSPLLAVQPVIDTVYLSADTNHAHGNGLVSQWWLSQFQGKNLANSDQTATGDRTHNWATHRFEINNATRASYLTDTFRIRRNGTNQSITGTLYNSSQATIDGFLMQMSRDDTASGGKFDRRFSFSWDSPTLNKNCFLYEFGVSQGIAINRRPELVKGNDSLIISIDSTLGLPTGTYSIVFSSSIYTGFIPLSAKVSLYDKYLGTTTQLGIRNNNDTFRYVFAIDGNAASARSRFILRMSYEVSPNRFIWEDADSARTNVPTYVLGMTGDSIKKMPMLTINGVGPDIHGNYTVAGGGGGTWGSITGTLSSQTDLQSALDLKAPLLNAALTGTPTAPTPALFDSSTKIATTRFVSMNSLSLAPSRIFRTRYAFVAKPQLVTGGIANTEVLNIGNTGAGSTDSILYNPAGLVGINGRVFMVRNITWDSVGSKWLTYSKAGTAYGSVIFEAGGEAAILHATPSGVDFSDQPHELFLASANGADGYGTKKLAGGLYTQSKATLYLMYDTANYAYHVSNTDNVWGSAAAQPVALLGSQAMHNTDGEIVRFENNLNNSSDFGANYFARSYGTIGAPTLVANTGVNAGRIGWKVYDGATYQIVGAIDGITRSTSPAANNVGLGLRFMTSQTNTAGLVTAMEIGYDRLIHHYNNYTRIEYTTVTNKVPTYPNFGYASNMNTGTVLQFGNISGSYGGGKIEGFSDSSVTTSNAISIKGIQGSTTSTTANTLFEYWKNTGTGSQQAIASTEIAHEHRAGATVISRMLGDGSTSIGTTSSPDASALFDGVSTTKGFLIPRMTSSQYSSISSKAIGLAAYSTDDSAFLYNDGLGTRNIGSRIVVNGLGSTTTTLGDLLLVNNTQAAAGAQQNPPSIGIFGWGWKTNATASSFKVGWTMSASVTQGANNPSTILSFSSYINGTVGARLTIGSDGTTTAGGSIFASGSTKLGLQSRSVFTSATDGNMMVSNNGATDMGLFQFGGTTSSFGALKRNGAGIDVKVADDSGFGAFQSLYERFGTGTPEGAVTAPVGAVFHRTDGGAGTSFYVKETGTGNTGWVAK